MKYSGIPIQMTKQQNVLRQIMINGPISKKELQEISDISWGMVSNITTQLLEEQYIESCTRETQGVGRKAEEYDIRHNHHLCIGIDFSYSGILVALTDMKGRVLEQQERQFGIREREHVLSQVFAVVDSLFERFSDKKILGIAFAIQGIVDIYEGISVLISAIDGWEDVPLKRIMEERYRVPVYLEHDPNCIMRCEQICGCLKKRNVEDAILINHNPRMGAGMSIMMRGQLCHGFHGKAGEIGTMPVDISPEGTFRYMEGHMTKEGFLRDYKKLTGKEITYREFQELLRENDEACLEVYHYLGQYLGFAVGTVANFLNPQVVIVHLSNQKQTFLYNRILDMTRRVFYDKTMELELSTLGPGAKAVGAALIVSENTIKQL